mmetsp:Transcript_104430/g.196628  ORF Transcript_104430/g.196628 Transcript_104430/m.196628 type:complete len:106 (+) Transcript_104430:85-402(+)
MDHSAVFEDFKKGMKHGAHAMVYLPPPTDGSNAPIMCGYGPGISGKAAYPPTNLVYLPPPTDGSNAPIMCGYGPGISGHCGGDSKKWAAAVAARNAGQYKAGGKK